MLIYMMLVAISFETKFNIQDSFVLLHMLNNAWLRTYEGFDGLTMVASIKLFLGSMA